MKSPAAYEKCMPDRTLRKCALLHTSDKRVLHIGFMPMLHFSLKQFADFVIICSESWCRYA